MGRFACELCGANNLVKDDGLFVCQNCGCKYTLEEAKKLMSGDVAQVADGGSVDRSERIKSYLMLSESALRAGVEDEALHYAIAALEVDARDLGAWRAKMRALFAKGFSFESHNAAERKKEIKSLAEAGGNVLALSDGDEQEALAVYHVCLEAATKFVRYRQCEAWEYVCAIELAGLVPEECYESHPQLDPLLSEFLDASLHKISWSQEDGRHVWHEGAGLRDALHNGRKARRCKFFNENPDFTKRYNEKADAIKRTEERLKEVRYLLISTGSFTKKQRDERKMLIPEEASLSQELPKLKEEFEALEREIAERIKVPFEPTV